MNKWSIKSKANLILLLSAAGIFVAFPFQHTFVGGLLFAAFSAATIGGLADSFAISALFGNPLRIPWPKWMGTRIISRNRERLIHELVEMVEKELLTVSMIRKTLEAHHLGDVLVHYLNEQGGLEDVQEISQQLVGDLLTRIDATDLAVAIEKLLHEHAARLQISDLITEIGQWTIKHGYDDRMISFLLQQCMKVIQTRQFRFLIEQVIASAIKSYEGDKFRRRLVDYTASINAHTISGKLQDWILQQLQQMSNEEHPQYIKLKQQLAQFLQRIESDDALRAQIEASKVKMLQSLQVRSFVEQFISNRLESLRIRMLRPTEPLQEGQDDPLPWLRKQLDIGMNKLNEQAELRTSLDQWLKKKLLGWVEQKHAVIGRTVRNKLHTFNEEELIRLVQEKAGSDLQYIRMNGMIVGMLVGLLFYLLTFWIGGLH